MLGQVSVCPLFFSLPSRLIPSVSTLYSVVIPKRSYLNALDSCLCVNHHRHRVQIHLLTRSDIIITTIKYSIFGATTLRDLCGGYMYFLSLYRLAAKP